MADFAGVSDQTIHNWMRLPGFPRGDDGSVCLWELAVWRATVEGTLTADVDGDLSGSDSPALEEFRRARAGQEQLKLLKMQGELIALEDLRDALNETSAVMKSTAEKIVKDAGNELADMLREAWEEVKRRMERLFGDDRTGGEIGSAENTEE